jgi:hypothetical protein
MVCFSLSDEPYKLKFELFLVQVLRVEQEVMVCTQVKIKTVDSLDSLRLPWTPGLGQEYHLSAEGGEAHESYRSSRDYSPICFSKNKKYIFCDSVFLWPSAFLFASKYVEIRNLCNRFRSSVFCS